MVSGHRNGRSRGVRIPGRERVGRGIGRLGAGTPRLCGSSPVTAPGPEREWARFPRQTYGVRSREATKACSSSVVHHSGREGQAAARPVRRNGKTLRRAFSHPSEGDGGGYEIRTREGVNPTRFPSERHRPLGESSAGNPTRGPGTGQTRPVSVVETGLPGDRRHGGCQGVQVVDLAAQVVEEGVGQVVAETVADHDALHQFVGQVIG